MARRPDPLTDISSAADALGYVNSQAQCLWSEQHTHIRADIATAIADDNAEQMDRLLAVLDCGVHIIRRDGWQDLAEFSLADEPRDCMHVVREWRKSVKVAATAAREAAEK